MQPIRANIGWILCQYDIMTSAFFLIAPSYCIIIIMTSLLFQMAGRYDPDMEEEVIGWIQTLLGEEIPSGQREVERALRSGITLVK